MIDRKVLDQLILSRQLLSKQEGFASAAHDPSQLLRDLLICHGAAELALAAICVQLNCVPDKKDIGLSDYFDSISRTTQPALTLQGADYVAELDQVRLESQLRFRLPNPRRWIRAKDETLEHLTVWCRQCLGLALPEIAAPTIVPPAADASVSGRDALLAHSSDLTGLLTGPVMPRYNCAGTADIKLPGWVRAEKARIANLSAGGCNVKSNFAFEVGEEIEMTLQVNKMSFRVAGRVVHIPLLDASGKAKASDLGIGIQFKNMTAGARERLQELIAKLKTSQVFRRRHVAN